MHPAFSILFFTTLAGAAQGLLVALALAQIGGVAMESSFVLQAVALGICVGFVCITLRPATLCPK